MEEIVDNLLENINSQRQLLIAHKQLLFQQQDSVTKLPNVVLVAKTTPSEINDRVNEPMPTDDVTHVATNIDKQAASSQKPMNFPILKESPQNFCPRSLLPSSPPAIAYTVVGGKLVATSTSPFTVYESIIAKYSRKKPKDSPPTSVKKTKLSSISVIKKAQLDAESASKVLGTQSSEKKPAFFVRRSNALNQMLPAVGKPEGARIEVDEDNKLDPDLEIFSSMVKQTKAVSADPIATVAEPTRGRRQSFASITSFGFSSEPGQTRASLDPRMAKKMMSAMPKYDMLFPPAPSVPFLPTKMRLAPANPVKLNDATKAAQSPDNEMARPEPYYSKRMDVIVIVEHCCDCEQHCTQSLRHDPKMYVQMANDVLYSIIDFISSSAVSGSNGDDHYPVRLFCMRTRPLSPDRIGAFEVTVAVNITPPVQPLLPSIAVSPQHQHIQGGSGGAAAAVVAKKVGSGSFLRRNDTPFGRQNLILEEEQPVVESLWATNLIYSKLQTKSWPSVQAIQKKVEQFLSAVLNGERAHNHFQNTIQQRSSVLQTDNGGNTLSEEEILQERDAAKVRAIDDSYSKWVERMRLPPKVEKHNLDLEWPDTPMGKRAPPCSGGNLQLLSSGTQSGDSKRKKDVQHAPGPYIDFKLSDQMSKTDFEGAVLKHFEVLDATMIDHDD